MSTQQMDPELARHIIKQAREHETYEGPVPEDDAKAVTDAAAIVQMAEEAWAANVKGPEVESILRLAAEGFDGTGDPSANGHGEPEPDQPAEASDNTDSRIDELSQEEPWEDYSKQPVKEIVEDLNVAADTDPEWEDLALHVWAYESTHKNRVRIMTALQKLAERVEGADDGEVATSAPEAAGDAEGAAASEAHAGAEGGVEGSEEDRPADPSPEPEAPAEVEPEPEQVPAPGPVVPVAAPSGESDDEAKQIRDQVLQAFKHERLHVPPLIEAEEVELPFDLTSISDGELQRLHGAFSAYAYRIAFLYMFEDRMAHIYKSMADDFVQQLIVHADKIDPQTSKPKTMGLLEAEASSDANVKLWRKAQRKHETFAFSYKQQRDSYLKNAETLSRQESMRQQEWERSGGGRKR